MGLWFGWSQMHKCVLDCTFPACITPERQAEAKSAACPFLACWNITQAGLRVNPAGIREVLKIAGNSHGLGYTSWDLSLH